MYRKEKEKLFIIYFIGIIVIIIVIVIWSLFLSFS